MKKILLFSFIILLSISGCKKDEETTGAVEIKIQLQYEGLPYVQSEVIQYNDDIQLFFSRLSFFISDANIVSTGNQSILLTELDYWRIAEAQFDSNSAEAGFSKRFDNIPTGSYNQLEFSIGVPPEMNAQAPSDFDSNSPLSDFSEYWEAWESFVFVKVEGKADSAGDGSFDTGLAFHIGGDQSYRRLNGNINLEVLEDEVAQISLIIDLKKMFETDSGMFDVLATPRLHTEELISVAQQLLNQLVSGFLIQS